MECVIQYLSKWRNWAPQLWTWNWTIIKIGKIFEVLESSLFSPARRPWLWSHNMGFSWRLVSILYLKNHWEGKGLHWNVNWTASSWKSCRFRVLPESPETCSQGTYNHWKRIYLLHLFWSWLWISGASSTRWGGCCHTLSFSVSVWMTYYGTIHQCKSFGLEDTSWLGWKWDAQKANVSFENTYERWRAGLKRTEAGIIITVICQKLIITR